MHVCMYVCIYFNAEIPYAYSNTYVHANFSVIRSFSYTNTNSHCNYSVVPKVMLQQLMVCQSM